MGINREVGSGGVSPSKEKVAVKRFVALTVIAENTVPFFDLIIIPYH